MLVFLLPSIHVEHLHFTIFISLPRECEDYLSFCLYSAIALIMHFMLNIFSVQLCVWDREFVPRASEGVINSSKNCCFTLDMLLNRKICLLFMLPS